MKKMIIMHALAIIALFASGVAFGQTQVPNTFQSGQPARASEVNENFSTLESAVNDNDAAIQGNSDAIASIPAMNSAQSLIEYRVIGFTASTDGAIQSTDGLLEGVAAMHSLCADPWDP